MIAYLREVIIHVRHKKAFFLQKCITATKKVIFLYSPMSVLLRKCDRCALRKRCAGSESWGWAVDDELI